MSKNDESEKGLSELPNLSEEQLTRSALGLPYWVHKVVVYGTTFFLIKRTPKIFFPYPVVTYPNNTVGTSIEDIEAALPALGAGDDQNWIIERINGTMLDREYKIHHNPAVKDKCPPVQFYSTLHEIAERKAVSKIHNTNTKPITCC